MKLIRTAILYIIAMTLLASCGVTSENTENNADTTLAPQTETNAPETGDTEVVPPEGEVEKKQVIAVVMGRARLPEISGKYNTWQNSGHNPDVSDSLGIRDISSVYYPSIGLYDVTDPDYQEYMMQLCKMSYIDVINYYVHSLTDLEDGSWWSESFKKTTRPLLEKYGIKSTARLEDPSKAVADGNDTKVQSAFSGILELLGDTVWTIDGRPVLSQFTVSGITSSTIDEWKAEHLAKYGVTPFFMLREAGTYLSSKWNKSVDGYYGWCELDDINSLDLQYSENNGDYRRYATLEQAKVNHDLYTARTKSLIENGTVKHYAEGLCPGFDDIAVWGWNTGPRKIERGDNAELYKYKWQSAVSNDAEMVVIPTWDDWGESTTIEPTLEYGTEYLEVTQKYAAEYKGIEAHSASLELPAWIYKIRKTTDSSAVLEKMNEASALIADGKFAEAEAMVKPLAEALEIPMTSKEFFNYPTTPTTVISETVAPKPTVGENGEEVFTPTADTYIKISASQNLDAGIEELIKVKAADSTSLTRYGYLKFDISASEKSDISKATLRLYCKFASTKESEVQSRDVNLYAAPEDWAECSFSWSTKPTLGEKLLDVDSSIFKNRTWVELDVTEYVKAKQDGILSFALVNEGADTENNHLELHSREAAEFKPELVIE